MYCTFQVSSKNYNLSKYQDKDVCVGPLIKYTVFDAFFGTLCGIILIVASLQKSLVMAKQSQTWLWVLNFTHLSSQCLLVTWMVLTVVISVKYLLVVLTHDWSSLEVCINNLNVCFKNFNPCHRHTQLVIFGGFFQQKCRHLLRQKNSWVYFHFELVHQLVKLNNKPLSIN